tara:strand:- start:7872 stop:10061 length:2190 start_codon:yes stop_codon:yes gene_type:complete
LINKNNQIKIEIDGKTIEAPKGQMLIEVSDDNNIYIPRFCYHKKLSIAANCRMCLVEVENAPKPLPACATPITDGMKVKTKSPFAMSAQKATMEFLLINHPLDCPICDQGGECELQDLAMGFGQDLSRYSEKKRVVQDKDIGPLVSTDMTRCIHCTRCVRFGEEITGIQELGTIGRSEFMQIGTFIEKSIDHELSANIIDLCPVGALNNKPYRYGARSWEMKSNLLISPHDCAGSNLNAHVLRGELKRIVPYENEKINETWISDRDRFGFEGIYSNDRLYEPLMKEEGSWSNKSWEQILNIVKDEISLTADNDANSLGFLVSASSTLEEMHLLSMIASHIDCNNIDSRLRVRDFEGQHEDPRWTGLEFPIEEIEQADSILIIGSNLRMEVPIIAHRVRKAALNGADISSINPLNYEFYFDQSVEIKSEIKDFSKELGLLLLAASKVLSRDLPDSITKELTDLSYDDVHMDLVRRLIDSKDTIILGGQLLLRHPDFSNIRRLLWLLSEFVGSKIGLLTEGSNSSGAALTGVLPHRRLGGHKRKTTGLDVQSMILSPRKVYITFALDPEYDVANSDLLNDAFEASDLVICFTSYDTPYLRKYADILLPIATFAETPGSFINVEGALQSFNAAANIDGNAKQGWRVLRVLANLLDVPDSNFDKLIDIKDNFLDAVGDYKNNPSSIDTSLFKLNYIDINYDKINVPIYSIDSFVRRCSSLQLTNISSSELVNK